MGIFQDAQGHSAVPDQALQNFKTNKDFMIVLITCMNEEDPIKSGHKIFPIITLWELSVAMEKKSSGLAQNLMQLFPHPMKFQLKFDFDRPAGLRY